MSDHNTPTELQHVVLLGDDQTVEQDEMLGDMATQHGAAVAVTFAFETGEPARGPDLTDVDAVVSALGQAISRRLPIWVPYPREDLGLEQHFRRLSLVLQRHGLNLLMGPHLTPCPTEGGMSVVDFALRSEVQAVDGLDRAALAAASVKTLEHEIEQALVAVSTGDQGSRTTPEAGTVWPDAQDGTVVSTQAGFDIVLNPPAPFPAPDAPWPEREPALRRYATGLTYELGLTQAAAADCLNYIGHRTPHGRLWRQATVSGLINGRYRNSR